MNKEKKRIGNRNKMLHIRCTGKKAYESTGGIMSHHCKQTWIAFINTCEAGLNPTGLPSADLW
jgi:hypothetical protein